MATVNYTVFDGEIVEEDRGGTIRGYVPDPLGSTRALLNSSQTITDTWSYWPYGEVESHTGSSITPFTQIGALGYYNTGTSQLYVRARYFSTLTGRWATVDSQWPNEAAYVYADCAPTTKRDITGRTPDNMSESSPECYLRHCCIWGEENEWWQDVSPTHCWVCGKSPRQKCAGGIPENIGRIEAGYRCSSGKQWLGNDYDRVKCKEIRGFGYSICGLAAMGCYCVSKTLRDNPPEYVKDPEDWDFHVCIHFWQDVVKCICARLGSPDKDCGIKLANSWMDDEK